MLYSVGTMHRVSGGLLAVNPFLQNRARAAGLTSQRGRDEEVGSIFLDDGLDELLSGGSAAQQPHAALELGHERHRVPDQVPPLDGRVPHLPTCKFPVIANTHTQTVKNSGFNLGHKSKNLLQLHEWNQHQVTFPCSTRLPLLPHQVSGVRIKMCSGL